MSFCVPFVMCCPFPGRLSSVGFKKKALESVRAGESTAFTSAKPAQDSAVDTATAQVEWSASVMRDITVGHKQRKLMNTNSILYDF